MIRAGVFDLIELSEAWIMIMIFKMFDTFIGMSIIELASILVIQAITLEPLLKSHCTHHIIIWHGVETVEGVFHPLFWTQTGLEHGCSAILGVAIPVVNILIVKAPRLEDHRVSIFGFEK